MELDPGKKAFVDAVMMPLGDDPGRRQILESAVATAAVYRASDVASEEMATSRMRATATRFPAAHRILAGLVPAIAITAIWLTLLSPAALRSIDAIWAANHMGRMVSTIRYDSPRVPSLPRPQSNSDRFELDPYCQRLLQRLPEEKRLLLVGDLGKPDKAGRWRTVWNRHSGDPAHFHAWAMAYRSDNEAWPENLVETGEALDPDNGMFRLMSAAARMKSAIGEQPPPRITRAERLAARAAGKPLPVTSRPGKPPRVIIDRKAFTAAWSDLETSLSMPRFDDYIKRLNRLRQDASPQPREFAEFCVAQFLTYSQPEDYSSGWIEMSSLAEGFALAAEEAAKAGDRDRLVAIGSLLVRTSRHLCENTSGIIPVFVSRRVARQGAEGVAKAWQDLGEPGKALPFEKLAARLDTKLHPAPPAAPDALTENRGSTLASAAFPFPARNPLSAPVTEADLRGGRMAEYSMYERFMLLAIFVLLALLLLFMFLVPLHDREQFGLLPARLAGLLDARDHAWIATLGVVLPVVLYLPSTRVEWIAPREFGLTGLQFFVRGAQALALVITIVTAVLQAVRWRLGRRGSILLLGWVGPDPGRLFTLLGLAAMPAAAILARTLSKWSVDEEWFYTALGIMTGLPLVWLGILAAGFFAGAKERGLHRRVQMTCARPFVALALVAAAIAVPAVHHEERQWVSRIGFESLKDGYTVFAPRYELEYAEWLADDALRHLNAVD